MTNAELFAKYTTDAMRTAPAFDVRDRKIVSALGLADEMIEFIRISDEMVCDDFDRGIDELGDIAWYLALLCDSFSINIDDFDLDKDRETGFVDAVSRIVGQIKKHIFHGHVLDMNKLHSAANDVAFGLDIIAAKHGATLENVLTRNIDKLRARYPDGFSVDRSVNRGVLDTVD